MTIGEKTMAPLSLPSSHQKKDKKYDNNVIIFFATKQRQKK
jgi:hypothetical protein